MDRTQSANQRTKFIISGKVIHGDHFGKTLGFPTANLDRRQYMQKRMKIKFGIYAGHAQFNLKSKILNLKSAIVIGPLDSKGLPKIEAHLIGFHGNLYGQKIVLHLQKYIRPFRKYKGIEELKKQIASDIRSIKTMKL
jgi:FAD synthase